MLFNPRSLLLHARWFHPFSLPFGRLPRRLFNPRYYLNWLATLQIPRLVPKRFCDGKGGKQGARGLMVRRPRFFPYNIPTTPRAPRYKQGGTIGDEATVQDQCQGKYPRNDKKRKEKLRKQEKKTWKEKGKEMRLLNGDDLSDIIFLWYYNQIIIDLLQQRLWCSSSELLWSVIT